jgi:mannose-6-phosphate isomerase-like protein (cupin superfamily)
MGKLSIANAEHYRWGEGCDGWHLVRQASLGVIQERMPPGTSETAHLHRRARQFFYILAGTAIFEVEDAPVEVSAGEGLEIPPGARHRIANPGPDDLEFLVISQPHSHGDREAAPVRPGP